MENFILFTLASLILIVTPGPGNILAIARGLSQGKMAACLSAMASGVGILVHVIAATVGLTALLMASAFAFMAVKFAGAAYLIWLGYQAIRSQSFVSFNKVKPASTRTILTTGFLTASLSPKIGVFILAFVPQFISSDVESITTDMALLGFWFAVLTAIIFAVMGMSAHLIANWLRARPKVVKGVNIGAGSALVGSGVSLAFAER